MHDCNSYCAMCILQILVFMLITMHTENWNEILMQSLSMTQLMFWAHDLYAFHTSDFLRVKIGLQVIFSNLAFVQLACSYNLVSWAHFWMTTSSIVHTKRQSCLENLHKPNIYYPKWTQIVAIILCILLAIVTTNSNNKTEMQFLQYHWQCCSA